MTELIHSAWFCANGNEIGCAKPRRKMLGMVQPLSKKTRHYQIISTPFRDGKVAAVHRTAMAIGSIVPTLPTNIPTRQLRRFPIHRHANPGAAARVIEENKLLDWPRVKLSVLREL
jgi:hypothetical protein